MLMNLPMWPLKSTTWDLVRTLNPGVSRETFSIRSVMKLVTDWPSRVKCGRRAKPPSSGSHYPPRVVSKPASANVKAAVMPARPPPTTNPFWVTWNWVCLEGFQGPDIQPSAILMRSLANSVAFLGFTLMHPGILIPDVGHFKEIFIQTYMPEVVLEEGPHGWGNWTRPRRSG